ncbi:XrtA-associated tyrosine autokinase [Inmirania thermothiophila]|uniref:Receptor protein-tyrosine kinase n=1 Tax=Inmirania thermothiophila TaxID=1750597 RepID=A0A3N1YBG2_9GAMM|nr:XrtA-associated tyrosine autokinase [Inmirania thermothiophila]ROR34737.1 receptor protein-tyrosine kinase [Inmirania thermothiophila]
MSIIERAMEKEGRRPAPETAPASPAGAAAAAPDAALRPQAVPQAQIDLERMRRRGYVTPDAEGRVVEEYRVIKRPLLANIARDEASRPEHANMIMVTSAMANEGKTFTAINLAMSIAMEMDRTVLLVDADVAHPSVASELGIPAGRGLIEVLAGEVRDLSEVLVRTNVPKLCVLPAGRRHQRSTELLGSAAMAALAGELARRYPDRVVIFDSPPLLQTTEASVLAGLMGQIVVVVEAERTSQRAVTEALELLEGCDCVGMVLNKTRRRGAAYYGGSYYGGYYGGGRS